MSNMTLVIGEPGSGKSTSIRNLNPESTFIINIDNKPFPIRGFKDKYKAKPDEGKLVNYYVSDKSPQICSAIRKISSSRPDVKVLVIDEFQALMSNAYFRARDEKGYQKYTDIGGAAWDVIDACRLARDDLYIIILTHSEKDNEGCFKMKTLGKMLDQNASIEGKFIQTFYSVVVDGQYKFLTRHNGTMGARSIMGMFKEPYIDNDFVEILKAYEQFN